MLVVLLSKDTKIKFDIKQKVNYLINFCNDIIIFAVQRYK